MRWIVLVALLATVCACKKDSKKKSTFSASMRSTGVAGEGLSLRSNTGGISLTNMAVTMTANSYVNLESFKVPIMRINLTYGDAGSGYTGTSPNFYTCAEADSADCLVDIVNTDLNDLLDGNTGQTVEFEEEVTYTGIAVEFCPDSSGSSQTYPIVVKGTTTLAGTDYVTNADSGLSTSGDAEEVEIEVSCSGFSTDLVEPVTVTAEDTANIVLWVEPSASVFVTSNGDYANSNCSNEDLAICVGLPAIFGTVDDSDPTIERHFLNVTTADSDGNFYADMLLTTLYNSDDEPFGAALNQFYNNSNGAKLMHSPQFIFSAIEERSNRLTYSYVDEDGDASEIISDLPRNEAAEDLTITELVEEEAEFDSSLVD